MGQDFFNNQENLRLGEMKAPRKKQSQESKPAQAFSPTPHCLQKKWGTRSSDLVSELHQKRIQEDQ